MSSLHQQASSVQRRHVLITYPTFDTSVEMKPIIDTTIPNVSNGCYNFNGQTFSATEKSASKWEVSTEDDLTAKALIQTGPAVSKSQSQMKKSSVSISVVNVVCNYRLRCHVKLRELATKSIDVIFKPEQNIVQMKLRKPKCVAKIYSSGKVFTTGPTTEAEALKACRRIARRVQKAGFPDVRFSNYRINNMMATSRVDFSVKLKEISELGPPYVYEPELDNRLHVNFEDIKCSVNVAPNGNITVFAASRELVLAGIKRIYPILFRFRCAEPPIRRLNPPEDSYDSNDKDGLLNKPVVRGYQPVVKPLTIQPKTSQSQNLIHTKIIPIQSFQPTIIRPLHLQVQQPIHGVFQDINKTSPKTNTNPVFIDLTGDNDFPVLTTSSAPPINLANAFISRPSLISSPENVHQIMDDVPLLSPDHHSNIFNTSLTSLNNSFTITSTVGQAPSISCPPEVDSNRNIDDFLDLF